jgi:hypothetical protein
MRRCIVAQKIPQSTFLKLWTNAMNSTDQSLNRLFIKFAVYSLFFRKKLTMDNTFSIKKCSQHWSFVLLRLSPFFEPFMQFKHNCSRTTFFTVRTSQHFNRFSSCFIILIQHLIAALCSILKPSTRRRPFLHIYIYIFFFFK